MRHLIPFFFIYVFFLSGMSAQQLYLEIETDPPVAAPLRDSLQGAPFFTDYRSLRDEAAAIEKRMNILGYVEASLASFSQKNDSVYTARYRLGKKYLYIKVYYDLANFNKKQLAAVFGTVGEGYLKIPIAAVEGTLEKLNTLQTANGDAFAKLKLTDIAMGAGGLTARLQATGHQQRTLDSIVLRGYAKFPRGFVRHYAGIKKGAVFYRGKITEQNRVLNSLAFAKTIKPPEVLFEPEKTTAFLYLQKMPNNLFDGILGFATDELTNKLQFNLELNNNLNYGERLTVNYKGDGGDQQNFRATVQLPFMFRSPLGLEAGLYIFKRDTTFVNAGQRVLATYQIAPKLTAAVGYGSDTSNRLLESAAAVGSVADYTSRFVTLNVNFRAMGDDGLFPTKTGLGVQLARGQRTTGKIKTYQTRIGVLAHHVFNINLKNSLFVQNSTQYLGSDHYFTNELFRFGGINTLRGFDENSIDASFYTVLNTEYRYRFSAVFYLHSITDLAYFENPVTEQSQRLYSFGAGLGVNTAGGLLRVSLASGLSENSDFKLNATKIHFSLKSRF
ncbi:MAG: hypothetical protein ACPGQR_05370 [Marinirhabdus sp.]